MQLIYLLPDFWAIQYSSAPLKTSTSTAIMNFSSTHLPSGTTDFGIGRLVLLYTFLQQFESSWSACQSANKRVTGHLPSMTSCTNSLCTPSYKTMFSFWVNVLPSPWFTNTCLPSAWDQINSSAPSSKINILSIFKHSFTCILCYLDSSVDRNG